MVARAKANVVAGISVLGLLWLCQCSLLLDADGLDVEDAAADAAGGARDAGPKDGAVRADASDGAAVDAAVDAPVDGPVPDAAEGGGDGGRSDAEAGPTDGGGSDAMARDAGQVDASKAPDAAGPPDAATTADASDASATPDASDAASTATPDGCALVTHSNGVGQTWQDCTPLGAHNRTQAQSACDALSAAANCVASTGCNLSFVGVSVAGPGNGMTTYLWVYAASNMSMYNPGDVIAYPSGSIQCNNLPRSSATWR
jgi:hypothetical protein